MSHEREHSASATIVSLRDYYPRGWRGVEPRQRRSAEAKPRRTEEWSPKVTHDWNQGLPVTEAELDVFEAHFGPFLDQLLGPRD